MAYSKISSQFIDKRSILKYIGSQSVGEIVDANYHNGFFYLFVKKTDWNIQIVIRNQMTQLVDSVFDWNDFGDLKALTPKHHWISSYLSGKELFLARSRLFFFLKNILNLGHVFFLFCVLFAYHSDSLFVFSILLQSSIPHLWRIPMKWFVRKIINFGQRLRERVKNSRICALNLDKK